MRWRHRLAPLLLEQRIEDVLVEDWLEKMDRELEPHRSGIVAVESVLAQLQTAGHTEKVPNRTSAMTAILLWLHLRPLLLSMVDTHDVVAMVLPWVLAPCALGDDAAASRRVPYFAVWDALAETLKKKTNMGAKLRLALKRGPLWHDKIAHRWSRLIQRSAMRLWRQAAITRGRTKRHAVARYRRIEAKGTVLRALQRWMCGVAILRQTDAASRRAVIKTDLQQGRDEQQEKRLRLAALKLELTNAEATLQAEAAGLVDARRNLPRMEAQEREARETWKQLSQAWMNVCDSLFGDVRETPPSANVQLWLTDSMPATFRQRAHRRRERLTASSVVLALERIGLTTDESSAWQSLVAAFPMVSLPLRASHFHDSYQLHLACLLQWLLSICAGGHCSSFLLRLPPPLRPPPVPLDASGDTVALATTMWMDGVSSLQGSVAAQRRYFASCGEVLRFGDAQEGMLAAQRLFHLLEPLGGSDGGGVPSLPLQRGLDVLLPDAVRPAVVVPVTFTDVESLFGFAAIVASLSFHSITHTVEVMTEMIDVGCDGIFLRESRLDGRVAQALQHAGNKWWETFFTHLRQRDGASALGIGSSGLIRLRYIFQVHGGIFIEEEDWNAMCKAVGSPRGVSLKGLQLLCCFCAKYASRSPYVPLHVDVETLMSALVPRMAELKGTSEEIQ